jgi:hypothetical protein
VDMHLVCYELFNFWSVLLPWALSLCMKVFNCEIRWILEMREV